MKKFAPKTAAKWVFNVSLGIGIIILISQLVSAWTAEDTIEIHIDDGGKSTFHGIIEVVARPVVPNWGQDQIMQFDLSPMGGEIGFNFDLDALGSGLYNLNASIIEADGTRTSAEFQNNIVLNTGGPDFTMNFHPENVQNSLLIKPQEEVVKLIEIK